ncbi:RHS repeat domain-containing protein [Pseudomonas sp. S1_E04]
MNSNSLAMHQHTPTLNVSDPRGLTVRQLRYWRSSPDQQAHAHIHRNVFDAVGRLLAKWDPRLFQEAAAPANLTLLRGLSGAVLCTRSVDAGWRVNLLGETGMPIHSWDGRGTRRSWTYDDQLRPLAVFEQAAVGEESCTERMVYGVGSHAFAEHNQCGRLIRHDDPAGTHHFNMFGLTGAVLDERRHFLRALDSPDWPLPVSERDVLLEPGAGAHSVFRFSALGELLEQTDAAGNRQLFNQTVDGLLRDAWLHLESAPQPQRVVSDIDYNAEGQVERQTAGNEVVSLFDYDPKNARLRRLRARRVGGEPLQDLNYGYDPVGNILSLEDKALPTRYFANQRIEPINRYVYDSLYQLIEATGWEAGTQNRGPAHLEDPAAVANYRQTYRYDAGGNLLALIHHGPQQHGRVLTAARHSNRCLPERNGVPPTEGEIAAAFDQNGNLLTLEPNRMLRWDGRNQLRQVTPVEREFLHDDTERYVYDVDGMRQRKVRSMQTNARTVLSETRYLPGLETRTVDGEVLHVVTAQAGRGTVQVLHWQSSSPRQLANDQYRYTLNDHLGSCSLELDSEARVVSRETYHPFGTTAFHERGDSSEESYRTLRYSGKECDATGLYYYGLRYYVPWLQRWLNPDPAGDIDGLNLFRMVRNNPLTYVDVDGRIPHEAPLDAVGENTVQNRLTNEYWKKILLDKQKQLTGEGAKGVPRKKVVAGKKKKKEEAPKRRLVDIVKEVAPPLLERLVQEGTNSPEVLRLYRGMKNDQAEAIMHWDVNSKLNVEMFIRSQEAKQLSASQLTSRLVKGNNLEIMPISGHLGDFDQAREYAKQQDESVMEFTLKPGAHALLFSQDYVALAAGGKGATSILPQIAALDSQVEYKVAAGGEGNLPGYIGMKSENIGPFSLVMGQSAPTHLLFQLFVQHVRKVPGLSE